MKLAQTMVALSGQFDAYADGRDNYTLKSPHSLMVLLRLAQTKPDTLYWQNYRDVLKDTLQAVQTQNREAIQQIRFSFWITGGWQTAISFVMKSRTSIQTIQQEIVEKEDLINDGMPSMRFGTSVRLSYEGYLAGLRHCLEIFEAEPPMVTPYWRCWRVQ
jgi:hypothetical protein